MLEAGAGNADLANFADGRSNDPRKGRISAADIDTRHAALLVGNGSQGHIERFFADQVQAFNAIAGRPDIFDSSLHAVVDLDPAFFAKRYAGLEGEGGIRSNPHA